MLVTEGVGSSGGGSIGSDENIRDRDEVSAGVMAKPGSKVDGIGMGWWSPVGEVGSIRVSISGDG